MITTTVSLHYIFRIFHVIQCQSHYKKSELMLMRRATASV